MSISAGLPLFTIHRDSYQIVDRSITLYTNRRMQAPAYGPQPIWGTRLASRCNMDVDLAARSVVAWLRRTPPENQPSYCWRMTSGVEIPLHEQSTR